LQASLPLKSNDKKEKRYTLLFPIENYVDDVVVPFPTIKETDMTRDVITRERLMELLDYNPETGTFIARTSFSRFTRAGDAIGTFLPKEGMTAILDGKRYALHNLAWLYIHGEWPAKQLLKLDGDPRNTAIANLALPQTGKRGEITQDRLKSVMSYDPQTGIFLWKIRPAKNIPIGSIAGRNELSNGNRYCSVDGVDYTMQRLAWLHQYGSLPDRPLRFLDGNQKNLAITNLALPEYDARTPEGRRAYERASRDKRFDVIRASALKHGPLGITIDVYQRLFEAQGGLCAICKRPETSMRNGKVKWLAVDHCHETDVVRGLLCEGCNRGIGMMQDDAGRLRAAADYVEKDHSVIFDGDTVVRLATSRKAKSKKEAA
jgi:Recombination endonuclease VII